MGLIFMWIAWQFAGNTMSGPNKTDELLTSDFVAAVNDDRVTEVTFEAGRNAIEGKYYPAKTAGASIADAYNKAFDAMNTGLGTARTTEEAPFESRVSTANLEAKNLGEERKFTTTWVGQDSLGQLMASHPGIKYEVKLPNGVLDAILS